MENRQRTARRESGWKVKKMYNRPKKDISSQKSMKGSVLVSLHSIVICAMVLVSFCFAWFSEVVQVPGDTIRAATYGITAEVSGNGTVTSGDFSSAVFGGEENEEYFAFEVENGRVYDIRLTTTEGTGAGKGYCIVSAGDDVHYTVPIGTRKSSSGYCSVEQEAVR